MDVLGLRLFALPATGAGGLGLRLLSICIHPPPESDVLGHMTPRLAPSGWLSGYGRREPGWWVGPWTKARRSETGVGWVPGASEVAGGFR